MKYEILFRKEALQDILEAVIWYENQSPGLGDELFIAIENAKRIIERNPFLYEVKYKGIRQVATRRFPYFIFYKIEADQKVIIYGIIHMKRSPITLKRRLK